MTSATTRRERLRAILSGPRCVFPASVYDPLSARAAQDLGYETMMLGGSVASLAILGAPDVVVLTLTELAEQCRRICRAGTLPLVVDADHGYGNALGVKRTVEELETAGVAALTIEDTLLPPTFGAADPALISLEEGAGKMRAARAGRDDPALVVVGRTSALAIAGLDDAIARLRAYEAAGVDALFVHGLRTREQLDAIAAAVRLPLFVAALPEALRDVDYLGSRNVRMCILGHQPFAAGVAAVRHALAAIRAGVAPNAVPGTPPDELMETLTRAADYARWTEEFLR